jgi:arabinofuranosyltransferase
MDIVRNGFNPDKEIVLWELSEMPQPKENVYIAGGIGFMGYFAEEDVKLIDQYALADPLLARIPAPPNQFAAHNQRGIPEGYVETIATGENQIANPALHEYYDKLSLIVSGDIFDRERLSAIFKMNFGQYDYLIEEYTKSHEYRQSLKVYGH